MNVKKLRVLPADHGDSRPVEFCLFPRAGDRNAEHFACGSCERVLFAGPAESERLYKCACGTVNAA